MENRGTTNEEKIICLELQVQNIINVIEMSRSKVKTTEEIINIFPDRNCEEVNDLNMIIYQLKCCIEIAEEKLAKVKISLEETKKSFSLTSH